MATEEKKYLSIKEVAKILGISRRSLHEHTVNGKIPAYRIGGRVIYKPDEVDAWVDNNKIKTAA